MKRPQLISLLIAACLITATAAVLIRMRPDADSDNGAEVDEPIGDDMTMVRLAPGKQSVAKIQTQPASRQTFVLTRTIPARFAYDESSHIAVRAPTAGVLQSVSVNPGEQVDAGTLIATLRSPEIGAARSLLLQRISELELATTEGNWQETVANGVQQLVGAIRKRQSIEDIKKQLSGSVLGKFRSDLLGKYNSLVLAEQLSGSLEQIQASGAVSGKIAREREAQLQEALSSLEASLEQATFETEQKRRETAANTRAAQQSVILARQQLVNLTGQSVPENFGQATAADETSLAILEIRSPIAGTIQERNFTATERVETGAELFVIADTSKLWVRADLRDRDIESVVANPGDVVRLSVGSQHDDQVTATVKYLGREIDPLSGTVPLVAEIDNQSERYRPGLFARVDVPVGHVDDVIVIPDSAVI
ncbi:MAG: efflux RND transporter periplasmic adaptor subunit, partial [Planctomycetales bacterium]|nr:efflux RND transporter periplasmic adaptor subunit [Planctomycetales bacterium]